MAQWVLARGRIYMRYTRCVKKVFLASDHAGFELKEALLPFLREHGYDVEDVGPATLNADDDYPDFIIPLAGKVAGHKGSFGIIMGGSGQGEAMAANRISGARTAVYYAPSPEILKLTREHNDANILSIGARFISVADAKEAVLTFLATEFTQDVRHVRRIAKLDA